MADAVLEDLWLPGGVRSDEPRHRPIAPRQLKALAVGADVATAAVTLGLAFAARRALPGPDASARDTHHAVLALVALAVWPIVFTHYGLYASRNIARRVEELRRVSKAVLTSVVVTAGVAFVLQLEVTRGWLVLQLVLGLVLVLGEREVVRRVLLHLRRTRRIRREVVVVGANREAAALAAMLNGDRSLGYQVVAVVGRDVDLAQDLDGVPVLGEVDEAGAVAERVGACGVIIAATAVTLEESNRLTRQLADAGFYVELSSTLLDVATERLSLRPLGRFPMLSVQPVRRDGWRSAAKRAFDLVVASLSLFAAAPVMVAVAVLIRLESGGPALFRQQRVGKDGVPFTIFKFRTMVQDAEERVIDLRDRNEADGPLFKMRDDPRVTRLGRVLRRLSIDELPQFFNVVRGEMSLVGPRPALPSEVSSWGPEVHERLKVQPGMTGAWQVNGRSLSSFEDYVRLDRYYVDNWSLVTDLAILAKTLPAVLLRRGAC